MDTSTIVCVVIILVAQIICVIAFIFNNTTSSKQYSKTDMKIYFIVGLIYGIIMSAIITMLIASQYM